MFLGHLPIMARKTQAKVTLEIHGNLEQSKGKHIEIH
jgi:hypothetical protein